MVANNALAERFNINFETESIGKFSDGKEI